MTERHEPEDVVYPGAPLRAVAIEIRFSPLLDAFPKFAAFQRRHVGEFNHLYETSVDDGEGIPDGGEFARPRTVVLMAQERAVTIARDQLAVITYGYSTGFAGFREWAMPWVREGLKDLAVDSVTRVSFRYENRIQHDIGSQDLGSILRVSLAAPGEAVARIRHAHLCWHQDWERGTVEVQVECCPNVSPDDVHLSITAHCRADSGSLDEVDALVREARRRARLTFEELITPTFRDRLKIAEPTGAQP